MKEYLGLVPKWVWITMALILIIVPLVVALTVPVYSGLVALAAEILVIIGLIFWLRKCWAQIGDIEDPCQAVLARFGKAIEAVGSGLYFRIYPIEQFKLFPTGQYVMKFQIPEGLYSKSEKGETPQPMKVKLAFVFRWPRVDREYTFPVTEEELSGYLNWCIEGLKRLLENDRFTLNKSTTEIREEYIRQSDSVGSFILDCIEEKAGDYVVKRDLFERYIDYCRDGAYDPLAENSFHRKFHTKVKVREIQPQIDVNGKLKQVKAWAGVKLKWKEN